MLWLFNLRGQVALVSAGAVDGAEDGLGLVEAFLVFGFGYGVCDDACAGLDAGVAVLCDEGADGDAGVEVAGEVGVEDRAAVDAATGRFELFDDLHGTDFGSAGEGSGGEAGAHGVYGGEFGLELTGDG